MTDLGEIYGKRREASGSWKHSGKISFRPAKWLYRQDGAANATFQMFPRI